MIVKGRDGPTAEVSVCNSVAVVRLDFNFRAEAWAEVVLTEEEVRDILRRMEHKKGD